MASLQDLIAQFNPDELIPQGRDDSGTMEYGRPDLKDYLWEKGFVALPAGVTPDSQGSGNYKGQTFDQLYKGTDPGGKWIENDGTYYWEKSPQYDHSTQQLNGGDSWQDKIGPYIPLMVIGAAWAAGAFGAAGSAFSGAVAEGGLSAVGGEALGAAASSVRRQPARAARQQTPQGLRRWRPMLD